MKKKLFAVLLTFCLALLPGLPALAAGAASPRLIDEADILTDSEESALLEQLDTVSETQGCDVVILTVDSLQGSTAQAFADNAYDAMGYGGDGILLLLSMEDRDWALSTTGYGITAFTDAGQEYIMDEILNRLGDGEYFTAFSGFAGLCDRFLTQAASGEPYDGASLPVESEPLVWILIAVVIGAVVAFIATGVMRAHLRSVGMQAAAEEYLRQGSLNVTDSQEIFLYSQVSRVAKPKPENSGSTTHVGSSGTTHGGSSGKF